VIFTGLNVAATLVVALALIYYARQEEERRWEGSRANFSVAVGLTRMEGGDGRWALDILLWNNGPATADPVLVTLEVGDSEIEPLQPPEVSSGSVIRFVPFTYPEAYPVRVATLCEVRADEPLLPGERLAISQEFNVDEARDAALQEDPSLKEGHAQLDIMFPSRDGLSTGLHWLDSSPSLIGSFLRSLVISGGNTFFYQKW